MRRTMRALLTSIALVAFAAPATAQEAPTITHQVITSFDGTPIYSTLFLPPDASATTPVPLIMRSHGWGGQGEREATGFVDTLLDNGYAVLTWDERGFGYSGGEVNVLKPELEGRDAVALIDWVATTVGEVAQEAPGDPLIGFTGGSYGGGIQLLTAALDERVDVLAPEITWNDLRYSLYGGGVINLGWGESLYALGVASATTAGLDPRNPAGPQEGGLAPELHQAQVEGVTANQASDQTLDYLGRSSLAVYGQERGVDIPTLFMQGSVDTLFDLTEAVDNFHHVRDRGAPAKLIAFCGGHVACPASYADAGDRAHLDRAILTWFERHLRGDASVDTGAPVEYRTNEGIWRSADDFTGLGEVPARGSGSVISTPAPTTLGTNLPIFTAQPSAPGDPHAFGFEVAAAGDGPLELVGIPTATVRVTGTGPAHLFLKLVDRESGEVVNLQETPVRVSGAPQTIPVRMSGIAYTLPAGHHLDLQVSTTSVMHAGARAPAQVDVDVEVAVPVR